jgi:CMP-N-acetylneuraminic acid synthetase
MKYQVIIPARKGSKRFPGKNKHKLSGVPLILHSVKYALEFFQPTEIWVNTDDTDIVEICKPFNVNFTIRPDHLGSDLTSTADVLEYQHRVFKLLGVTCEAMILLQPTNPIRPINLLTDVIFAFERSSRNSVATFSTLKKKFGSLKSGFFEPGNYKPGQRMQDVHNFIFENGLIYITKISSVEKGEIITSDVLPFMIDSIESRIDIDEIEDLYFAEYILKNFKNG